VAASIASRGIVICPALLISDVMTVAVAAL
jgi:hypothetical protein